MKRFFGLMNLILCFELIIGPHFPGTKIFSIEAAKAQTCPAGLVMDSTLNRCITSDQQAALINATASCNGDKECYKRLAEEELKKGEEEGKIEEAVKNKSGLFNTGIKAVGVALPLIIAAKSLLASKPCLSASKIAMAAGGIALFVGDMMANGKHKKCLKKIEDDWEKKKSATTEKTSSGISKVSMSQDQSEAFEMLAKSEECMQSSAKMKAGLYGASAAAFGVSAVLSVMEIMKLKSLRIAAANPATAAKAGPLLAAFEAKVTCAPAAANISPQHQFDSRAIVREYSLNLKQLHNAKDAAAFMVYYDSMNENAFETFSSPSVDSYFEYKNSFETLNDDQNFLSALKMIAIKVYEEVTPIKSAHAFALGSLLTRPEPRAAISGVLTGWSVIMMMHSSKQAKVAKNRAEFLRGLKKEFDDANGAISCTPEERSVSANANCYCYTEGGQRNQARANSQVCQQLFSGKTLAKAGDFNSLDFSKQRVCIAANGTADENCNCKNTKSCLNGIPGSTGNLGLGAISVASNGMRSLNDLTSGQIGAGSINPVAAGNLAARLLDEKNKLENQGKLDPNKQKSLAKQIEGSLIAAAGGQTTPSQEQSPLQMGMSPSDAAAALEKELGGQGRSFENVNGSPAVAQPGSSNPGDVEGFKLDSEEPAAIDTSAQVAEAMAQNLDYGQTDITKSDSNIFKILSNRYQRSGMRRLFDEEGKATAEPANKNEISQ